MDRKRLGALGLAAALALASTSLAFWLGANFGGVTYAVLGHDLGNALLYLWFIIPAVFIASRVLSQVRSLNHRLELGDPLKALSMGYATGFCFALLSQALYYGVLLPQLHSEDDFSITPSILGLLSDWQSLAGGGIAVILFFALLPWNRPALKEADF